MGAITAVLVAVLLGLPALGGAEPVEVMVWDFGGVPGHQAWIRQAVDDFNARQQEIHVVLEIRDWATQRESLISTTIVGEGPDIIRVHHKYSVEFGQLGGLYALENFPDFPEVAAKFFPNVLEQVQYQGKHYGLPITMLPFVLAANRSILDRYGMGIPGTWEEIRAMGPVLKEAGISVLTIPGVNLDTAYRFLPLLYKAGGRVFDEGWTRATFNGPAGLAALEFLIELKQSGYIPAASAAYAFDENAAHWCTEKAALSIEGPWWQDIVLGNYKFDTAKLALGQIPGPAQPIEANPPATLLDVVMVSITGYTQVPEQAWTVLKALNVDDPVWKVPNPAMGGLPAHKAAYEPGVQSRYIDLEVLAEAGRNGVGWPGHPGVTEIQRCIADAINMALTGMLSPKEALDAAALEVNEILSDY